MRKWGIKSKLFWCPSCSVPLRQETCSKCGSKGVPLNVAEPGDLRPAFSGDLKLIQEAMKNEFGTVSLIRDLFICEGCVYLNKTPHYDDMKEVITGGTIVGRLYFDPHLYMWRWRLNKLSAEIALNNGLVKEFRVPKPRPLMDLGEGEREGDQAVVTDSSGNVVGLAVVRKGRYRVQTLFREKSIPPIRKKSSLTDFLLANDYWFRTRISKSVKHLSVMAEKTKLPVVVSYSGGKDSLVALHLTLTAGLEPDLMFNDTGIELPPTVRNVEHVARTYGLELVLASAGNAFWESVKEFGPPAKDYRWCCKVVKMSPIAKVYKTRYHNGLMAVIGQRAYESVDRSRSGAVWRNRWLPAALNVSPLQEWDQLTVWGYIIKNKLPVNELYFKGFERLGCFLCPAGNVAEYFMVEKEYPELWEKWIRFLREWKKRIGAPDEWVTYHLWRWLNPLSQGRKRVEVWKGLRRPADWSEEYRKWSGYSATLIEGEEGSEYVKIRVKPGIRITAIKEQWKILGTDFVDLNNKVLVKKGSRTIISIEENIIEAHSNDAFDDAVKALKLAVRSEKCAGCGNCVTWCPNDAISINDGRPIVDPERCTGCGVCVEVCPVAEVFTERLLVPQLIGSPKGRPRKRHSVSIALHRAERAVTQEVKEPEYGGISDFIS